MRKLASTAWSNVRSGYYERWLSVEPPKSKPPSMSEAIRRMRGRAVIAEIKFRSPALGRLRSRTTDPLEIANQMVKGGAIGISVLTEPQIFEGDMAILNELAKSLDVPLLMKDIIVSPMQLEAGRNAGAGTALLIMRLFDGGFCELSLDEMIEAAKDLGLEILLETNGPEEFKRALEYDVEMIGINNRDLDTLETSLEVTKMALSAVGRVDRIVVSESGIATPEDVRYLRSLGSDAFLVGSSIMSSRDIEGKVRELVMA